MSKPCPIFGRAIYMDCQDCDERMCMRMSKTKYKTISIGIDQSYQNTGVSISADGKLLLVRSIHLDKYKNNSEKRKVLRKKLAEMVYQIKPKGVEIICVIERIRLKSQGFINIDYIKSIGALNSVIVDVMSTFNIETYSVDTRCWKAQVVGTSKPKKNKYGVPDEKWPTVQWCIKQGFRSSILIDVTGTRKTKGVFKKDGKKYMYNNDASDSSAISMFWFNGDHSKLEVEK